MLCFILAKMNFVCSVQCVFLSTNHLLVSICLLSRSVKAKGLCFRKMNDQNGCKRRSDPGLVVLQVCMAAFCTKQFGSRCLKQNKTEIPFHGYGGLHFEAYPIVFQRSTVLFLTRSNAQASVYSYSRAIGLSCSL